MKKKYVVMLAAVLACGVLLTGCGSKDSSSNNVPPVNNNTGNVNNTNDAGDTNANVVNDLGNVGDTDNVEDVDNTDDVNVPDNETAGNTHELAQNDVMHSVFFDLQVNSVETTDALEEWVPTDGYVFLVVNVSITNTFGVEIPMSYADFPVLWNDGEDGSWPDCDFSNAFPEEYTIADGETQTNNLVYTIPQDLNEVVMEYYDLFSSGERGDTFNLHISVN